MLAFGTQQTTDTQTSALNLTSQTETQPEKEESSLSFAQLLKGVIQTKSDEIMQTITSFSDAKESNITQQTTQEETLISLLKDGSSDEKSITSSLLQTPQLNSQLFEKLDISELKKLIFDAKEFLKEQIKQTDGYKNAHLKELPKSLKGLTQLAQKYELNLSKIIFEDFTSMAQKDLQSLQNITNKLTIQTQTSLKEQLQTTLQEKETQQNFNKTESDTLKKIGSIPLFEERASKQNFSTQQLVQTKQKKEEIKTEKFSSKNRLESLLKGKHTVVSENNSTPLNITREFSKESATVIAPKASTELSKNLESLLHDTQEGSTSSNELKTNSITPPKTDSLEVKINEAKQMVRYLSSDIKNAIDDYKSPFTKVKLQLNPQELGKVDLTIVQRGNNLHVNISSNNTAVQTLALNANELKTQLQNNGINNATLNFNNSSQSDSSQSQQHQQQKNQQRASAEYGYFDDEANEEYYDNLEIVVPYYA